MSYDIWLEIETGDDQWADVVEIGNYTSNVSRMWREALGGVWLSEFDGWSCTAAADPLATAVKRMQADPNTYRLMNPPNGWGNYEGALTYLERLAKACAEHPRCRIRVSA